MTQSGPETIEQRDFSAKNAEADVAGASLATTNHGGAPRLGSRLLLILLSLYLFLVSINAMGSGLKAYAEDDVNEARIQKLFSYGNNPFVGLAAGIEIRNLRKEHGISILLTDHNVRETLTVTDRSYIIDEGKVIRHGTPKELINDDLVRRTYLGDTFRGDEFG